MSVIVVLLSALFPASAQNYTTDAILKRTTGKIATLECSGIARTKKEAIEMAKKSVIYTYLYNGIDGLNDNKPLLGSKPSAGAAQYVGQLLGTTRYANYIRSCTIADKTNKTAAKGAAFNYKVTITRGASGVGGNITMIGGVIG